MEKDHKYTLLQICDIISLCHKAAEAEYKKEKYGDFPPFELLVAKQEKVKVELRKENTNHHEPHIHITHSDKIDASVSLDNFEVLAGNLDKKISHSKAKRKTGNTTLNLEAAK